MECKTKRLIGLKETENYMDNRKIYSHKMRKFPTLDERNDFYSNITKRTKELIEALAK